MRITDYFNSLFEKIKVYTFSRFKGITVYGLVGRSGTGKSYHAKQVAAKTRFPSSSMTGSL